MQNQLHELPIFKNLPQYALDAIAQKGEVRHFGAGAPLFLEGQKAQGIHFILSGIVKVIRTTSKGNERILYLARVGSMVGEGCLQGLICVQEVEAEYENPIITHPASAMATCHVETLFIASTNLHHCLELYPSFALRMLKALATRQRMFIHKVAAQAERSAIRRVAAYILHRSFMEGSDTISLGVAREDLANLLGHARETTSRQLSVLLDMQAIECTGPSGRVMRILHRDMLQRIVDEGLE